MKFSVAQIYTYRGDLAQNLEHHFEFIELAASAGADVVVFPELSLTGYEPSLASRLAMSSHDKRIEPIQERSDTTEITIAVGLPLIVQDGICISLVFFQPGQERVVYHKKYLHKDELPFFVANDHPATMRIGNVTVAPSICYELSVPEHAERAYELGAEIYLSSVSKSAQGVASAHERLAAISKTYSMPVMLCNNVGPSDDFVGAGRSAVWDRNGTKVAELESSVEGLVVFDLSDSLATAMVV